MTLIDTSSLVHFLRAKGERAVKERVAAILHSGEAAICEVVAVELLLGVGSREDQREVEELCDLMIMLPIHEGVWRQARTLALRCRKNGTPVPSSDLVIAACALAHGASLDYEDEHFAIIKDLGQFR